MTTFVPQTTAMRILCILLLVCGVISCTDKQPSSMLNPDVLSTQTFTINNGRDTVLTTTNGAHIEVEKGSFSGSEGNVKLIVKEAYTMQDIIKAGLVTQTEGRPLKSGGMIFIDAVDKSVDIARPITVSIPTETFDGDMKAFKGKVDEGRINWTAPESLLDTVPKMVKYGKEIFQANCATCHRLDKALTGPSLQNVEGRGPWNDRNKLIRFTRNPAAFIPLTQYTKCLAATYNGQIMPAFPQLSDKDLSAVYDYVSYGSRVEIENNRCLDSCRQYDSAMFSLEIAKSNRRYLVDENPSLTSVDYQATVVDSSFQQGGPLPEEKKDKVVFESNKAEYYKFSIDAFGWYNVDALLKDDESLKPSQLTVLLEGEQKTHVDIYLVIPSMKVFTLAGRTGRTDEFAFDTKDGKLPLPQGEQAYIVAMSENSDGILFGQKKFITSLSQQVKIRVEPSSKDVVTAFFQLSDFSDVKVTVQESKNANEIRQIDMSIKSLKAGAEKLKPKTCNCDCGESTNPINQADTLSGFRQK